MIVANEEKRVSLVLEPRKDTTRSSVEKLSDRRTLIGGGGKVGQSSEKMGLRGYLWRQRSRYGQMTIEGSE